MNRLKVEFAFVLALLVAQIGLDAVADVSPQTSDAQSHPSIQFVHPQANEIVSDYPIFIETKVSNFTVAPPVQYWGRVQQEEAAIGHIHYTLDDSPIFATKATKVMFGQSSDKPLPLGEHFLRAELVNNNHNSLNPPVFVMIPIRCERPDKEKHPASSRTIPVDDQIRQQLQMLDQQLKDVQKQFQQVK